ncbi:MAG: hypothetical protein CFE21_07730 [Bacteroidetes bacterium B1(2017)]|nr:MAG: hypothetical protein CFE21_07730 [Bacteroidetes bacterium B1(2017)]
MRLVFALLSCFLFGLNLKAQTTVPIYSKKYILQTDSITLDTLPILVGSVKIKGYQEGLDYRINYLHGALISIRIPLATHLDCEYSALSYNFKKSYQNKDPKLIQPVFSEVQNPFKFDARSSGFDPVLKNEGLVSNGSIMRGLSLGNSQNAVVNANLNLQLAGKINNDVSVLAAISDDNNPIQPEGNTQELQDFDQVYVQFSKNANKLVVGDYLMTKPEPSYFLNYYKKSRGLLAQTQFEIKPKQSLQVNAQAALSRGRFVRNIMNGVEGNQGPYRLTGPNGEVFIILISGTEAVYLDGEKLTRGEQNDYTIDYNSGELVFMPKRLITQYSRIVVEFQYSDRNFARTLFGFSTKWETAKSTVYLNYYTEQDNKNQPFQQSLTDSNKFLLASVGDQLNEAKVTSAKRIYPFDSKKILYRKIDSLGFQNIYVHTIDPTSDTVFYELRFSFVGTNKGNYKQGASSSNGRVFQWIEPINGVPQGDFEPFIQLIAPNKKQLLTLGSMVRFDPNNSMAIELARSDNNKNLYSDLDNANDAGYAVKLESKNELKLGGKEKTVQSAVHYEYTDAQFRYVERYRNVEFNRIWNRQLSNGNESDTGNKEHIINWKLAFNHAKYGTSFYQLGYYNKGEGSFIGWRHQIGFDLKNTRNKFQSTAEWLNGQQKPTAYTSAYGTEIKNLQLNYTRLLRKINVGVRTNAEQSTFKNAGDSLLSGSYAYEQVALYLRNKDSSQLTYFIDINTRLDQIPFSLILKNHTLAKEAKAGISFLQKNFNKLSIDASYRNFEVLDSAFKDLKPEQTLLSRIEYDYSFLKRLITANTYIQVGSGNELRRDFQYVEVPIGQGVYVWKDFNEDGQQQLNEFQPASMADKNLANYIKVFLPTTTLLKVNSSQLSQTLNINNFSTKRYTGFKGFANKFSNQTAWRYDRKVLADPAHSLTSIVNLNVKDTSLISLASVFRNTLFFNKNNPKYGLDFSMQKQQSKNLLTNGFETRLREEYTFGARLNLTANWALTGNYAIGTRGYTSEYFISNNYSYQFHELKPKLSYQFQQKWRVGVNYSLVQSSNLPELGGDESKTNELGSEIRYSFIKMGVLTLKYTHYQVGFKGNVNSPLAYDMLQGLSIGKNQLWSINMQQRFGNNLQINISYEGRKSGSLAIIHTGKMEARYIF